VLEPRPLAIVVQDRTYRPAITAAGTGSMAAIGAECFLEAQHHTAAPEADVVGVPRRD